MNPGKELLIDQMTYRIMGSDDFNFTYYLRECLMRIPLRDLKSIVYDKDVHILKTTGSTVLGLDPLFYSPGKGDRVLVIFVGNFSKCPPHEIMYVIAHEFAHLYLGHYDKNRFAGQESEAQADDQLRTWGFEEELKRQQQNFGHIT